MPDKTYLHWSQAGGPNECEHGYAEGIDCPNCDANPRMRELRAEVERLNREWHDSEQARIAAVDEVERLRALVENYRTILRNMGMVDDAVRALGQ